MTIYPKLYCKKITDIKVEYLKKHNINALILDVDNTLLEFDLNIIDGLEDWYKNINENDIKCIILSNSNKLKKIKMVADLLGIPFITFATKPLKRGFIKAQKQLNVPNENIAVIGDQIFTDVIGANRSKMYSILVEPIAKKDIWMTKIKRPLEELIIKKYLKKKVGK